MDGAIHVRGASRERFLGLIVARLETEGFEMTEANAAEDDNGVGPSERVRPASSSRPTLRRLIVNRSGRWLAMSEHAIDVETWAIYLSRALETSVLCVVGSQDRSSHARLIRFTLGQPSETLDIPADLARDKNGRFLLPCSVLDPWLAPGGRPARMKHIVLTPETSSTADILEAIAETIELPRLWIDANEADSEAGDLELDFTRP
ncbi:MAG: hypothetical protein IPK13_01430 [Deltaproteobacteria bacterium]|nr:hypothetical protein [Deltaproteobacteria bacterium]